METIAASEPKAKRAKNSRKAKAAANTAKRGAAPAKVVADVDAKPDPFLEPPLPFEDQSHASVTAPAPRVDAAIEKKPSKSTLAGRKAKARSHPVAAMPSPIARATAMQERRITRASLLEQWPELAEPENAECLIDTLDGATSDDALIVQMVEFINYREDRAAARKARIKRINEEIDADEKAFTKARDVLKHFMEETGRTKFDQGGISISVYPGREPVTVTDEKLLPDEYWRTIPESKVVDKVKINADVRLGIAIPGVTKGNKPTVMAIR